VPIKSESENDVNYTDLSPKQAYALGVISTLLENYFPSIGEIARALDVKKQTATQTLLVLERLGYISRSKGDRCSVRLTKKPLPYATQKRAA
jgi:DNA-binding MarR family transcriptional regulator